MLISCTNAIYPTNPIPFRTLIICLERLITFRHCVLAITHKVSFQVEAIDSLYNLIREVAVVQVNTM